MCTPDRADELGADEVEEVDFWRHCALLVAGARVTRDEEAAADRRARVERSIFVRGYTSLYQYAFWLYRRE